MTKQVLHDEEFGVIQIRRIKTASAIKIGVDSSGQLRATMPPRAPLYLVKRLVASSRQPIRDLLARSLPDTVYESGMQIGKTHSLIIVSGAVLSITRSGTTLRATIPSTVLATSPEVQQLIRQAVIKALRKEAKSYLPRRLKMLAERHGYQYEKVRFSHASTRWGSCSSAGTISLNIALMKLPFELIDYVLIHELCHTKQMNHSSAFWELVAAADPEYQIHRRMVRSHTPTI